MHTAPTILSRRSFVLAAPALLLSPWLGVPAARAWGKPLVVFAASSLRAALTRIDALWRANGHAGPQFSFAPSQALARRIDEEQAADLFLSDDVKWVDWLAGRGRVVRGSQRNLVSDRLVLAERTPSPRKFAFTLGADLNGLLGAGGGLALADAASGPAGRAARQALVSLGVWTTLAKRLTSVQSDRAALLLVERGAAKAAVATATAVLAAPGVSVAGMIPQSSYQPIVYAGCIVAGAVHSAQAAALLSYLDGGAAQAVFHNCGFSDVAPATPRQDATREMPQGVLRGMLQ